jgi:rhodanese-related sulfurtransferase
MAPPAYFPLNVKLNKEGYKDIQEVLHRGDTALSPAAFEVAANETGAVVLDVRDPLSFAHGFVPRSINIGIDGSFAPWVGSLIRDIEQPILLIADEERIEEVITRLSRVGFDNILGFLAGGIDAWKKSGKEIDTIESIKGEEFAKRTARNEGPVFDVRKKSEYLSEHVIDAENTPLDELNDHLAEFPTEGTFFIHCAGGYRSMIAASILKARGIHNLVDVMGGFGAIKHTDAKVSDYVCPSTL